MASAKWVSTTTPLTSPTRDYSGVRIYEHFLNITIRIGTDRYSEHVITATSGVHQWTTSIVY